MITDKTKKRLEEIQKENKHKAKKLASVDLNNNNKMNAKKIKAVEYYNSLSDKQKEIFKKELEYKPIRNNYVKYLRHVFPDFIDTPFHRFLANVCQSVVEKIENGEVVRLCISCPPQHGKSATITETLPSWFLGRNPNLRCIVTGYNADIAEKFGDRNRQKVKTLGKELFGTEISESQDNKTMWEIAGKSGGMLATGIFGSLTSNSSNLTIVDDPYKNGEEADNPDIREKVYSTFCDSVMTRSGGKGNAIIVIHTRWHDDDLIGKLTKLGWTVINIPCVCDARDNYLGRKIGETLFPQRGYDAQWALNMEKTIGKKKWNALYQGKPYIDGGNIIKREDIVFYTKQTLPSEFDEITLSCDLSFGGTKKENDPYCMSLVGRKGGVHYLLKVFNKRASFSTTCNTIRFVRNEHQQLKKILVEKKANGQATIELLNKEIGGLVPYDPKGKSKEDRLNAVSPFFESHSFLFPCEDIEPNIEQFIDQLLRFPKTTHDDFVDTISQYLLNYEYRYGGRVATESGFSLLANAIRGF